MNTVLMPFCDGNEDVINMQHRWLQEILPKATTPYEIVEKLGYVRNVQLSFAVCVDHEKVKTVRKPNFLHSVLEVLGTVLCDKTPLAVLHDETEHGLV